MNVVVCEECLERTNLSNSRYNKLYTRGWVRGDRWICDGCRPLYNLLMKSEPEWTRISLPQCVVELVGDRPRLRHRGNSLYVFIPGHELANKDGWVSVYRLVMNTGTPSVLPPSSMV